MGPRLVSRRLWFSIDIMFLMGSGLSYQKKEKKGIKTNWVIHEYRPTDFPNQSDYVICRLKKKTDEKADDSIPDEGESSCHVPSGYRNISENTADEGESSRQVPFPHGNILENTSLEVRRNSTPDEGESSRQVPFPYGNIPENTSLEDNPQLLPNLKSVMNNGWLDSDSPLTLQSHMVMEPGEINQWLSNSSVDSSTNMPHQVICNQLASEETPAHKSQHQSVDQYVDDIAGADFTDNFGDSMILNYDDYFDWDDDTNQNLDNMMDD